jgi:hypothetical protein
VLPPELAKQLTAAEAPMVETRFAPAARGLASAVDSAAGRPAGETLRLMAGEGRSGMSIAAAEVLVADSAIAKVERPAAVRMIAERIDQHFDALPAELESWSRGGRTEMVDQEVDDPRAYGEQVGRLAVGVVEIYEQNPGSAQQNAASFDRYAAQQDPVARFAGGYDPAAAPLGSVNPQAVTTATPSSATSKEAKSTGLDSR